MRLFIDRGGFIQEKMEEYLITIICNRASFARPTT
jgi:hypothetical protein